MIPAMHDAERPDDRRWTSVSEEALQQIHRIERQATIRRSGAAGHQVTWRRFGEGPPLLLLHGGHGSWLHWVRNIEARSASHQLWVADLPGYGSSDVPASPTLEGLLGSLMAAIDAALGATTPFALAGFSFGGLVAAHVAARRGGVSKLALLGPAGHGGARRPRGELRSWRDCLNPPDHARLHEVMRHNLLMHMLHDAESVDDLALQVHTEACLRTRFHSKSISLAGGLQDSLAAYAGSLLVVWGAEDVTTTPAALARAPWLARAEGEVVVLPGSGHWVQYEAADAVNRRLERFLA